MEKHTRGTQRVKADRARAVHGSTMTNGIEGRRSARAPLRPAEGASRVDQPVAEDRLHPLRVQLRHRGADRRPRARQDPRRQGAPRVAGLHLQQGDAARPLPERPRPADEPAAAARRRHATRRSTGTPRSPRSPSGSPRSATTHGGETIFYYGGGGQGNHLGGAYAARRCARSASRYRSSALAQEKTGEGWVDAHLYGGHTRGDFEHAEVARVRRQEPVAVAELPARARRRCKRDRQGPERAMIVIDPVRHRDGRDGRLPPARAARARDAWCLAALLGVLVQEDLVDHAFLAEHTTGAEPVLDALARDRRRRLRATRCGVDEELIRAAARRIAARRQRRDVRGPRRPAGARTARSAPTSTSCIWLADRQLRQAGRDAPALVDGAARALRHCASAARRSTGALIVGGLRAVQRDRRGDPHRPSRALPRDARSRAPTRRTRSPTRKRFREALRRARPASS